MRRFIIQSTTCRCNFKISVHWYLSIWLCVFVKQASYFKSIYQVYWLAYLPRILLLCRLETKELNKSAILINTASQPHLVKAICPRNIWADVRCISHIIWDSQRYLVSQTEDTFRAQKREGFKNSALQQQRKYLKAISF